VISAAPSSSAALQRPGHANLGSGLFKHGQVMRRGSSPAKGISSSSSTIQQGGSPSSAARQPQDLANETNSEIHIPRGQVHLESSRMTLESQGNLKLSAQQGITLEAQTTLDLKGGSGQTLTETQLEVKASDS